MIAAPVRLDRLERGLFLALGAALAPAQVGWAYGQGAFDSMPGDLVNLTLASMAKSGGAGERLFLPFDELTLSVDGAPEGERQIISINGIRFVHDVLGGDTTETVAQALVLELGGDPEDPWTATLGPGASEITVSPSTFGGVWDLSIRGSMSVSGKTSSGAAALLTDGMLTCSITIQTFSKSRSLQTGAWGMAARVLAAMSDDDTLQALSDHGVGVSAVGAPVDISALSGANWETRCTLDVDLTVCSAFTRPIDTIEEVELGASFSDLAGSLLGQAETIITAP